MNAPIATKPRWRRSLERLVRRLLCPHRWQPVNDIFWGAHSSWDSVFQMKRRWQCCDCGKRIVASNPVSYMPPNAEVSDGGPLTHELPAAQYRRSLH